MSRALLWALACGCSAADAPLPATGVLTTEAFRSPTLGGELLLRLRVPPDLDEDGSYPTIFVLDPTFAGLRQYEHTVGLVSAWEAEGGSPGVLVVGLDYDDLRRRFQDYVPSVPLSEDFSQPDGADRFYAALRDDVLPYVQDRLPVDASRQLLQGHSDGASFVWYATLRHRDGAAPLFSAALAADSGMPQWIFTMERWHAEASQDLPVSLYVARATENGPFQAATYDEITRRLEGRAYPSLALRYDVFETDHGGVVPLAFAAGLGAWLEGAP